MTSTTRGARRRTILEPVRSEPGSTAGGLLLAACLLGGCSADDGAASGESSTAATSSSSGGTTPGASSGGGPETTSGPSETTSAGPSEGSSSSDGSGTPGGSDDSTSTTGSTSTGVDVEDDYPQRLVLLYFGHGAFKDMLVSGDASAWEFGPAMAAFEPYKDRTTIVSGVSMEYPDALTNPVNAHSGAIAALLTGTLEVENPDDPDSTFVGGGPSIDLAIAAELPVMLFRTVALGGGPAATPRVVTWLGDGEPVLPETDPVQVHQRLFTDLAFPEPWPRVEGAIEALATDAADFENGPVETRERERLSLHARATALALALDMTRVVTVQQGNSGGLGAPWLNLPHIDGVLGGEYHFGLHEAIGGSAEARADVAAVTEAWMTQYAAFVAELAAIPEGPHTLLDHTTFVLLSEGGDLDVSAHASIDLPIIIIGNEHTTLRRGEYVELASANQADLALSLAHLMGVELPGFGSPDLDGAVLPELFDE